MAKRDVEFEIDENMDFQRREWSAQRIGWWALTAFVGAAILGLFGGGPLSRSEAGGGTARLRIEYERFIRMGAPTRIVVHTGAPAAGLSLHIARDYFESLKVEQLVPAPAAIEVGATEVTLRFDAPAAAGPLSVVFDFEPRQFGTRRASFKTSGGASVTFRQFVYF